MRYIFLFLLIFSSSTLVFSISKTYEFTFANSHQNWLGDFTDYPKDSEEFYELSWGWENIPYNQSIYKKGLFISGNNHSDDLFMFMKTQVGGLKSESDYYVTIMVDLLSNVPVGQSGIGGAEGEAVYVKAGAATIEPQKILSSEYYTLNVDKGNQHTGGVNAVVIGDLANPAVNPDQRTYEILSLNNISSPLSVKSDDKGNMWIFIGTDSGFEGLTKYYIGKVKVDIQEK